MVPKINRRNSTVSREVVLIGGGGAPRAES